MTDSRLKQVNKLCKDEGPVLRASVLRSAGFCGKDTEELIQLGFLQRLRRGYYASPEKLNDMDTYGILAALVPDAVISLFSAAQYHDLSSVIPQKIDITLPVYRRVPVLPDDIHITIHKAIPQIYKVGIQTVKKNGYPLKIYDRERTVCDFFRMRLQIGKDCAFEVLKNYMAGKKYLQKLSEYAELLQIKGVLYPYVEVLAA
jgi:predicted transcriptional regulator of viral defense system